MIKWGKLGSRDRLLISEIVTRVIHSGDFHPVDRLSMEMDIAAVHIAQPLRLNDLLHADGFDFNHDIAGIFRHIDRHTGELKNCFSPRFSVPEMQL